MSLNSLGSLSKNATTAPEGAEARKTKLSFINLETRLNEKAPFLSRTIRTTHKTNSICLTTWGRSVGSPAKLQAAEKLLPRLWNLKNSYGMKSPDIWIFDCTERASGSMKTPTKGKDRGKWRQNNEELRTLINVLTNWTQSDSPEGIAREWEEQSGEIKHLKLNSNKPLRRTKFTIRLWKLKQLNLKKTLKVVNSRSRGVGNRRKPTSLQSSRPKTNWIRIKL